MQLSLDTNSCIFVTMMAFFRNTFGSGDPLKKVYLFEHDAKKMADLVSLHPAKETGGNLFGLWTDNDEPVYALLTYGNMPV